jgi:hypothetical protein
MIGLARKCMLYAAGPANTEMGAPTGGRMLLSNTTTADEARRYAEAAAATFVGSQRHGGSHG